MLVTGAATLRTRGYSAESLVVDVTDVATTSALLEKIPAFNILLSNPGTDRSKPFAVLTRDDDYDAVMSLNVRTVFFVRQAVARGMEL